MRMVGSMACAWKGFNYNKGLWVLTITQGQVLAQLASCNRQTDRCADNQTDMQVQHIVSCSIERH